MKKDQKLYDYFKPSSYTLTLVPESSLVRLTINGLKIGRPSQRITLHQEGFRIRQATITYSGKDAEAEIIPNRINHLKLRQQVRLHSADMLFPGKYKVELEYKLSPEKLNELRKLEAGSPNRALVPSVDEPAAWAASTFEIKP